MKKGKLIVIDGLDGCGKSTQLGLANEHLLDMGYMVKTVSFPDYESPSSALVKMYLKGEFADDPDMVSAYAASSFYAVDRYASYMKDWKSDYYKGTIILAARYIGSNAIHQMSKLPQDEWDDFIDWLYDYECNKLGLPRPDSVIFLDMPLDISQKLLSKRYKDDESLKDIHESHIGYLAKCRNSALYAAQKMDWNVISCNDGDEPLDAEVISEQILKIVKKTVKNNTEE